MPKDRNAAASSASLPDQAAARRDPRKAQLSRPSRAAGTSRDGNASRSPQPRPPRETPAVTLAQLLAGGRSWNQRLAAGGAKRLRGLPRLRALLEASRSLLDEDPHDMLHFAKLAVCAADRLPSRQLGVRGVADLRALSWAELANAYRICDQLHRSAGAMNRAVYWCHHGTGSDLLLARVADLLASVLGYQRRFPQGRDLLALVQRSHAVAGRQQLAARALVKQGNLAGWEGRPEAALPLLRRAFDLLDPDVDPDLAHLTVWNMLAHLVELGRFRTARRLLWRCRALIEGVVEPHRVRWFEGTIFAGLAEPERAEAALKQARQAFNERQQVYPASRIGLELAILWARQGRIEEVYELCGEVTAAFRSLGVAREAIATLLVLQRASLVGSQLIDGIEMAIGFLRDLERRPRPLGARGI